MVDPISGAYTPPPVIRFKPDPGEPAVDVTASPRQTAYLVTAQEQRNETRLRNRAVLQGDEILYSRRTFHQTYQNGAVVYTGGLTTVVTRERRGNPLHEATVQRQGSGRQDTGVGAVQGEEESQHSSPMRQIATDATKQTEQELAQYKRELSIQRVRVDNRRERAEAQLEQAVQDGDILQTQWAQREVDGLERREDAIKREEVKVEQERLQQRLEEAQSEVNTALPKDLGPAARSPGGLYGEERDPDPAVGRRLDLFV
jgi:hypothetical protein